MGQEKSQLLYA